MAPVPPSTQPFAAREHLPETQPDAAGPGRRSPLRPPTTGMLPPREQPHSSEQVLVLATDRAHDLVYLRTVLFHAPLQGWPTPRLVRCGIHEAPFHIQTLQPALVIVADHTVLRWGARQIALCRLCKRSLAPHTPVVVLYEGRRLFGHAALDQAAPDAILSTSTLEALFCLTLSRLLTPDE